MLPPGDVRNCLEALANVEPLMGELLHYRFTEGSLKGQSFGNLFLAALNGISGRWRRSWGLCRWGRGKVDFDS